MRKRLKMDAGIKSLLMGLLAGTILFLLASVVLAFVMTKSDISYPVIRYVCFGITAAASLTAGFVGKKRSRLKGICAGLIAAALLVVPVFLLTVLVNRFRFSEEILLLLPVGLLFGAIGGIISSNMR